MQASRSGLFDDLDDHELARDHGVDVLSTRVYFDGPEISVGGGVDMAVTASGELAAPARCDGQEAGIQQARARLRAEFPDARPGLVERTLRAALDRLSTARIESFCLVLAERSTRETLRARSQE